MTPRPFVLFGPAHLTALGLAFVIPIALAALTRPIGNRRIERSLCVVLAALLAVNWALWMSLLYEKGWLTIGSELPLNLCDWATIATIVTLIRPNQRSYELAYFWSLAGTLQGMMTPDIVYDFPDRQFIQFFVYHSGIIVSVLYLTFGMGFRPVPASIPRAIFWSLFYAAVAGFADWLLGTNYGLLREKPPYPTILDFMPAWPYYIAVLVALGVVSAFVYYAPWFVFDRIRRRSNENVSPHAQPRINP